MKDYHQDSDLSRWLVTCHLNWLPGGHVQAGVASHVLKTYSFSESNCYFYQRKPQTLVFTVEVKYLILSLFLLSKKTKLIPIVANKVIRFTKIFMIYCRCWCSGVCNLAMSWLLTDWWGRCHTDTLVTAWDGEDENITSRAQTWRRGAERFTRK